MNKSFSDNLEEILHDMWENGEVIEQAPGIFLSRPRVEEATKAILSLIREEIVPEEDVFKSKQRYAVGKVPYWIAQTVNRRNGWNACREEVLKRIGEV